MKNKVISHLKEDIKTFKREAQEDKELVKDLKRKSYPKPGAAKEAAMNKPKKEKKKPEKYNPKKKMASGKVEKVMHEFKHGELHSGSKKGPQVTNRKQAIAIALSEARKAGQNVKKRK